MTSTLNGAVSQVILLPTCLLVLIVLGCVLLFYRYRRAGLTLVIASAGALAALSMPFTAVHLIRTLQVYPSVNPADMAKVEAIVVLGGGINHDQPEYAADVSNNTTLERLRYAAFLYNQYELPILVTGGAPSGGEAEGWVMRRELESLFNVPVRWLEVESDNTAQNAAFSRRTLRTVGIDTIALVTHAWHMPRAKQIFEKAGFNTVPAPTGFYIKGFEGIMNFVPQADYLSLSNTAIREWIGRAWYRLRSNP